MLHLLHFLYIYKEVYIIYKYMFYIYELKKKCNVTLFAQRSKTMLDFYKISYLEKGNKKDRYLEVFPNFQIIISKHIMVRGGMFYAIWDEAAGLWSTSEYDVARLVDAHLREFAEELEKETQTPVRVKYLTDFSSHSWSQYKLFVQKMFDNNVQLDQKLAFENTETTRTDYVSKKLPYPLREGESNAFDSLFGVLYDDENLTKLMWSIGSIVAGTSKNIQKFYVLFGLPGTGKSTALNLIERLFPGHTTAFEAGSMTAASSNFSTEAFKENPLVALDHEGDLSRIKNNSILTSIVSHDHIVMNAKFQKPYKMRLNSTLFVASNAPVMITQRASGLLRRLIDIRPTGLVVSPRDYELFTSQLDFELGAIADKCLRLYRQLGRNHYNKYLAMDMMMRTNVFFNFINEHVLEFTREEWVSLTKAWDLYKQWCEDSGIQRPMSRQQFRDELKYYFRHFHSVTRVDGKQMRSIFKVFDTDMFQKEAELRKTEPVLYNWLNLSEQTSVFDRDHSDQPAQQASKDGPPRYKWDNVTTTLKDVPTEELHYVLPKGDLITLDFDLKSDDGEKSLELNIEAARKFPATYAETSKSGSGLHLHYFWDGDVSKLSRIYEPGIEILRPAGNFSIRRKLLLCNDHAITTIDSGLPLKPKGDNMVNKKTLANERSLRTLILRNLHKEIHPATKPSVDFIDKILHDANDQGMIYDVSDLRPFILEFASKSSNNGPYCVEVALNMKYKSDTEEVEEDKPQDDRLVFFDIEVFPNLFLVCWKYEDSDTVIRMINPESREIEKLMEARLVGYNNRRYDNHILYGAYLGYDNEQIYQLSKRIITSRSRDAYFREAYGISHADVYDYATKKQSLKEWQIELGLFHSEVEVNWDEPLPEERWEEAADYCENDVISTQQVHEHRIGDYKARQILSDLSGLPVNASTMTHAARIVFGKTRGQKDSFVHPDLSREFPGYVYDKGESTYRGEVVGEGGYVWAEPGMYKNVLYMDVSSMHPTSIEVMNLFGSYTKNYTALKEARVLIKGGRLEEASKLFNGALAKYLEDPDDVSDLSYALKISLNIVYGFTAARFDNPFRDDRNKDNVVAKRGALFMVDLRHALLERGAKVIHFKTDSVKVADYNKADMEFIVAFGKKYGYHFGVEAVFDRLVLINDAVLVGHIGGVDQWYAVGARFIQPYVYKSLFTKEAIAFEDLTESRTVKKGIMYIEKDGDMSFVGRVGLFCPMKTSGGTLYRVLEDKKYAVTGTKGYKWLPADAVKELGKEDDIDVSYFEAQVDAALEKIAKFGDPNMFIKGD